MSLNVSCCSSIHSLFISSIGAVANLFDASCFYNAIQSADNNSLSAQETRTIMRDALEYNSSIIGYHYFVNNPTPGENGTLPAFDILADSERKNPDEFMITEKIGDIPSLDDPKHNVDWLELKALADQDAFAKYVFRIATAGGQPPSLVSTRVRSYFRRHGT